MIPGASVEQCLVLSEMTEELRHTLAANARTTEILQELLREV